MSIASRIVEIARQEVGVREHGVNTGPRVQVYQASTSLAGTGWPWCAAFVEWVWERAGLTVHPANPSTYWMCRIAAERGEISDTPRVGGAIIWCGTHTGNVAGIGRTVVYTIEGNASDAVRALTRSIAGARFIAPAGLGAVAAEAERPRLYLLEDLGARPRVVGPWRTKRAAERVHSRLAPATRRRAKVVVTGAGVYAIRIGNPRRYGPWLDDADRKRARPVLERRVGRRLRPYSKLSRREAAPAGTAEPLGKTD